MLLVASPRSFDSAHFYRRLAMPILAICQCGKQYQFKDEVAGRRAKCLDCGQVVYIPGVRVARPAEQQAAPASASPPPPPTP
jgi:hypothetical protein